MAQTRDMSALFPDFSLLPIFMQSPSFAHLLPQIFCESIPSLRALTHFLNPGHHYSFVCAERAPFLTVFLSTMELVIVLTGKSDRVTLLKIPCCLHLET